jgi:hypothetical protein
MSAILAPPVWEGPEQSGNGHPDGNGVSPGTPPGR